MSPLISIATVPSMVPTSQPSSARGVRAPVAWPTSMVTEWWTAPTSRSFRATGPAERTRTVGFPTLVALPRPARDISRGVRFPLLLEWLRTAALAKRTRDASSTRARLSLSVERCRGVGQGGRSSGASGSSPPGRRTPPLADRMGQESLRVSRGQGAGLRLGRSRWSGHYPGVRPRWFGPGPLRTATRGR